MNKTGYLGPRGTHSEEAALYIESLTAPEEKAELVPYPEIADVFEAVRLGAVDKALVPVENSLEGPINITLDIIARTDSIGVSRELIWPVRNNLLAKCEARDIKTIHSHGQPFSQCRSFLRSSFSWAALVEEASTAKAAEIVSRSDLAEGMAAIGTRRAAEIYGLNIIAEDIQDNRENCTRFYEIYGGKSRRKDKDEEPPLSKGQALLVCQIDGSKAGSLLAVLQDFARFGVNLTRIESRPARTYLGAYIFFFDLEVDNNIEAIRQAVEAVRRRSIWLRYPGEFPVIRTDSY